MPRRALTSPGIIAVILFALGAAAAPARATSLIVPDQAATIQAAVDAPVDTVLVRPGAYAESILIGRPMALVGLPGGGPAEVPVLDALRIYASSGGLFRFERLQLNGAANLDNGSPSDIRFDRCDLRGGIVDSYWDHYNISISRSQVAGSLELWTDWIELDSCVVSGSVRPTKECEVRVRGCTIQGGGIFCPTNQSAVVEGNTIRGGLYGRGVYSLADGITVSNNLIEDCPYGAIQIDRGWATVANNVIRRCGGGIGLGSVDGSVVGNVVRDVREHGLAVGDAWTIDISGNVFSNCGGSGVWIAYVQRERTTVRNNTSCFNGVSGFASAPHEYEQQVWTGNIAYGNAWYGLAWREAGVSTFSCNDWFGNSVENVQGGTLPSGDFAVDPQFCDPQGGDFRLNSASPLLDRPGCGLIGALGVGCGATATLVQRFTAGRVPDGVRVVWEVAEGATASEIWVERAEGASSEAWTRPLMERSTDGRAVVELDRSAAPDRTYRYRLVALEGGDVTVLDPGIAVDAQARLEFRLAEVGPSPGAGPVRIAFALGQAAEIEVDVFDLLGRRVASPAHGAWTAGAHEVEWSGRLRGGQPAPSGMYVIRYAYPGGQDQRRIVRLP